MTKNHEDRRARAQPGENLNRRVGARIVKDRQKGDTIMSYWQLFYHIIWATKGRQPLLTPQVESEVYGMLKGKAVGLGATLFALNGAEDHVHMVAAIPPKISVAKFIGQVKGISATRFNKSGRSNTPLRWQEGYGVFSFDAKRLPNYVAYVERQKEHHAQATTIPVLERVDGEGPVIVRETEHVYSVEEVEWRREFGDT